MLFSLCFAVIATTIPCHNETRIPINLPQSIHWYKETSWLCKKIELTHLQIMWLTDDDVFESDTCQFNREFESTLTWKQIKQFRKAMQLVLIDIVCETKASISGENRGLLSSHPLYERYYLPLIKYLKDSN